MFKNFFKSLGKIFGGTFLGIPIALMSSVYFSSFALFLGAISIYNTQEIKNKMTGSITYKSDPFSEFIAGLSFLPIKQSWEKLVEQPITSGLKTVFDPAVSYLQTCHKEEGPRELISTKPSASPAPLGSKGMLPQGEKAPKIP